MDRLIIAGLALAVLGLGFLLWRQRRKLRQLDAQLENFLNHGGAPVPIALEEDALARLQNGICDLQDRYLRAVELQKEENSRTESLTADISHQLKTPLTTLRLYTEMDAPAHMEASLEQISRMEHLIQSLLRLERLRADGYRFCFEKARVEDLILEQWSFLEPVFPGRELAIRGSADIRCDRKWLGEALGNLLKNACQHTTPGDTIRVCLEQSPRAFFCSLEDPGGGVPEKDLPHLFRRFYRPEGEHFGGAGLGLAIAREIIRRHHGTIVASNTGKGLRLEITLPILDTYLTKT